MLQSAEAKKVGKKKIARKCSIIATFVTLELGNCLPEELGKSSSVASSALICLALASCISA